MCFGGGGAPKPAPPAEPLKQVDQASGQAQGEMRRRMALAKGLESTWNRGMMSGAASAAAAPKAANLGGTK